MQHTETNYDSINKLWHGRRIQSRYEPDCSVGRAVLEALQANPENIAQICHHNGKQYTNGEIATLSIRVAQHLEDMGLPQCAVIGICAGNSDFIAPLFYGALLAGLTVNTLDPSLKSESIRHICSTTMPQLMFSDGSIYQKVSQALHETQLDCQIFTTYQHLRDVPEITVFLTETGSEKQYKPPKLQHGCDQTAVIVCSSGTTGLPKGVCLSHASLLNVHLSAPALSMVWLSYSKLSWITGIKFFICCALTSAICVRTADDFSLESFFDIIQTHKVVVVHTSPAQVALLASSNKIKDYNLSSIYAYLTGGSPLSCRFVAALQPFMPNARFFSTYGVSEIGGAVSYGVLDEKGSNGKLMDNIEVKVINSEGQHLEANEIGEICIRSAFNWAGYYNQPKATAEILDAEGWIHIGDVGYMSSEGNLYIIDRIKEILKYNNYQFYPTEIERVISELPGVMEVCVCGLPDEVSTFLPAAAIVRSMDSELTESMVSEYVAKTLEDFKQLRGGVYFVNSLPRSGSGKCARREVVTLIQKIQNNNNHKLSHK